MPRARGTNGLVTIAEVPGVCLALILAGKKFSVFLGLVRGCVLPWHIASQLA